MARPVRNAPQENALSSWRTFFATTKTHAGRRLLQSERNATLLIDVLRSYMVAGKFRVQDFVVMPDHFMCFGALARTRRLREPCS
jgi:putative transposase